MSKTIGFYGSGNMAQAMINGLLDADLYQPEDIFVYNHQYDGSLKNLAETKKIMPILTPAELLEKTDIIILAVKPFVLSTLLSQIKDSIKENTVLISIAAGVTITQIEELIGQHKIVRIMPNTPVMVSEGMSSVSPNDLVTEKELKMILTIFNSFGKAKQVSESLIDAVVGVSGSAPAYVFMFIEALADGAVAQGMNRSAAYEFAAQAVLGSAKMVLETGKHPGELKDMVCSPGGTTIAAVKSLEEDAFRASVMNAVHTAARKNHEMSQ